MSGTLANSDPIDIEALEAAAYEEVELGIVAEEATDEDADDKDGADGASPTDELEDSMPVEDDSSDDGDGDDDAETSTLDDEDEDAEDTDEQEKLTLATASKRIASAQQKMHLATAEAAKFRKDSDSLKEEVKSWQTKYETLQAEIDNGKAMKSQDRKFQTVLETLPEEHREALELNPELLSLTEAIIKGMGINTGSTPKKSEPEKAEDVGAQQQITPEQQTWMDGVLDKCPDFLVDRSTTEFASFLKDKAPLVAAINSRYGDLDPAGAEKLHANFLKYKQESATTKKPQTTSRVVGRNVTQPSGNVGKVGRSRVSIEEDYERSL